MDDSAADNGTHHNTLQGVAGVRAVSPLGGKPGGVDRPLSIRVEHGDVGDSPAPQRFEQSLERWFADTERFARQLREVSHDDYVTMKRSQYRRQRTVFQALHL